MLTGPCALHTVGTCGIYTTHTHDMSAFVRSTGLCDRMLLYVKRVGLGGEGSMRFFMGWGC